MNILFALYGDFTSNSADPLVLYARELQLAGNNCAVAVPFGPESVSQHENPAFRPILYGDVLDGLDCIFPDGRPADVIHACTPREVVRRFVTAYMAKRATPLVVYLEDNELWVSMRALGFDETNLVRHTEAEISDLLPDALAHPFYYDTFIGLADAVAIIQDKLRIKVPPWVHCETVMIGVDLELFTPRAPDLSLRAKYGVAQHEKVIVYHGGMNGFTRPAIENLCRAVGLINQHGYPCRLLRTGRFPLDFLGQLPREASSAINDLGLLPKRELPDVLALADVFVQPGQINAFEDLRLPGKIPEFLAMARPVILPNVNIANLFQDGLDAVFLSTGNPDEISAKCIETFSDPERANRIGRAGRLIAEKYFDVRSQARRLEEVYRTACNVFNARIASETWGGAGPNTTVAQLLARKLRLLASSNAEFGFSAGDMLREHSRYVEFLQRRVAGLQSVIAEHDIAEKNAQLISLKQQMSERDRHIAELSKVIDGFVNSRSWRITLPFRIARSFLEKVRERMNSFRLLGRL
jgi:glycosyltransferase involved in cell wall biosynthesis